MLQQIPMLREGMTHNGQPVNEKYLNWLFPQLEVLCKRGQLWGYNQIPTPRDAPDLLRSRLSHSVRKVYLMPKSLWVDVEPLLSSPGRVLVERAADNFMGAHLRALGVPSGNFKIIGIDMYPLPEKDKVAWSDFIAEITAEAAAS